MDVVWCTVDVMVIVVDGSGASFLEAVSVRACDCFGAMVVSAGVCIAV